MGALSFGPTIARNRLTYHSNMRFPKAIAGLFLLLGLAAASAASDVSGRWTGTAEVKMPDGEVRTYPLHLEITRSGERITGTIGREPDEKLPLEKAKLEGNRLSFEVVPPDAGAPVAFELEVAEGRLEGKLKGETDGGPLSGKVTLARTAG
jgi:hypothetical protein